MRSSINSWFNDKQRRYIKVDLDVVLAFFTERKAIFNELHNTDIIMSIGGTTIFFGRILGKRGRIDENGGKSCAYDFALIYNKLRYCWTDRAIICTICNWRVWLEIIQGSLAHVTASRADFGRSGSTVWTRVWAGVPKLGSAGFSNHKGSSSGDHRGIWSNLE